MSSSWRRSIERSRPEYRRRLAWASALFALLLLAEFFLLQNLLSRDLSQRHMIETVTSYRKDVDQTARRLGELLVKQGSDNLFEVSDQVRVITEQLALGLVRKTGFHHVSVYDDHGRMVVTVSVEGHDLLTIRGSMGREVAGQPLAPMPQELIPEGLRVPRSAAVLGPLASGRQRTVGDESLVLVAIPAGAFPAPAAASGLEFAAGENARRTAGVVQLALDGSDLSQDVLKLKSDLQKKVIAWAFLSIVVLIVGFLYVLKLLQRTRRLEAEAQLADRLAYIGTLASGLAHEIRNPLNAMNMNLQLLEEELVQQARQDDQTRRDPQTQADTRELLETTRGEIGRLDRLVNSFLAYARPSPLLLEPRRLSAVLDELVQFLRADFTRNGLDLRTNYPADLPEIPIDEGQIKQALMNILINSRQMLRPGQAVELTAAPAAEAEVMIRISDNGPGIEPGTLPRIFEVFYSTRPGGTGLGLPIAQRIIEAHGGRIEVDSSPGRGTNFRIFLKRRPPALPAPQAAFEGSHA